MFQIPATTWIAKFKVAYQKDLSEMGNVPWTLTTIYSHVQIEKFITEDPENMDQLIYRANKASNSSWGKGRSCLRSRKQGVKNRAV